MNINKSLQMIFVLLLIIPTFLLLGGFKYTLHDANAQTYDNKHFVVSKELSSDVRLSYHNYADSEIYKTNIEITIITGNQTLTITPTINQGYNPTLFFGDFLGNGLEQILLFIDSGGSGAYTYVYIYSVQNNELTVIFDYQNYHFTYKTSIKDNILKIYNDTQTFLVDIHDKPTSDMPTYIAPFNTALPYFNIALQKYYLITLQKIVGGYEANTYGYVANLIELSTEENLVLTGGVIENFRNPSDYTYRNVTANSKSLKQTLDQSIREHEHKMTAKCRLFV